ncbi:MAG: PilZ domain-containing protein [Gammaproteobacteria bacterium]|nr:PilZ domain-containing protein [Gammaproteobacteria bacterium]
MHEQKRASGRPGVISLSIKDKNALYAAYMSFVKDGGLFIPTNRDYALGDEVFLLLSLMDEPEKLPVAGSVAWLSPRGAQGGRVPGVGVHFNGDEGAIRARNKIEGYLAGLLNGDGPTHTM